MTSPVWTTSGASLPRPSHTLRAALIASLMLHSVSWMTWPTSIRKTVSSPLPACPRWAVFTCTTMALATKGLVAAFTLQSVYPCRYSKLPASRLECFYIYIAALVLAAEGEIVVLAFSSFTSSSHRYLLGVATAKSITGCFLRVWSGDSTTRR